MQPYFVFVQVFYPHSLSGFNENVITLSPCPFAGSSPLILAILSCAEPVHPDQSPREAAKKIVYLTSRPKIPTSMSPV